LIPLVSLTTENERKALLAKSGEGFVYGVAINGVTGTGAKYGEHLDEQLAYLESVSDIPVLAGFGVSTQDDVERFGKVCDGVIVGSFIVDALHNGKKDEVATFLQSAAK
jgi:tryptophan synthase alpha chain